MFFSFQAWITAPITARITITANQLTMITARITITANQLTNELTTATWHQHGIGNMASTWFGHGVTTIAAPTAPGKSTNNGNMA